MEGSRDSVSLSSLCPRCPRLRPLFLRTTALIYHNAPQVASYAFLLPDDAGVVRRVLLPLLDLLNHANDDAANAVVGREGGAFIARATKAISAGEEVR